jgi:hypothetical protein
MLGVVLRNADLSLKTHRGKRTTLEFCQPGVRNTPVNLCSHMHFPQFLRFPQLLRPKKEFSGSNERLNSLEVTTAGEVLTSPGRALGTRELTLCFKESESAATIGCSLDRLLRRVAGWRRDSRLSQNCWPARSGLSGRCPERDHRAIWSSPCCGASVSRCYSRNISKSDDRSLI